MADESRQVAGAHKLQNIVLVLDQQFSQMVENS